MLIAAGDYETDVSNREKFLSVHFDSWINIKVQAGWKV